MLINSSRIAGSAKSIALHGQPEHSLAVRSNPDRSVAQRSQPGQWPAQRAQPGQWPAQRAQPDEWSALRSQPEPVKPLSLTDGCPSTRPRDAPVEGAETPEAFIQRIYEQHAAFLQSFVLRLTGGDRHWAEDVAQETLVRAWRLADRLQEDGQRHMLPWLITVARRIVMNDRRSRRARPQEVFGSFFEPVPVTDEMEQALQRQVLVDALAEIGEAHRSVVVAIYVLGKSTEEVAQSLGIPRGTVKSRSYYGLRALREALQRRGFSA